MDISHLQSSLVSLLLTSVEREFQVKRLETEISLVNAANSTLKNEIKRLENERNSARSLAFTSKFDFPSFGPEFARLVTEKFSLEDSERIETIEKENLKLIDELNEKTAKLKFQEEEIREMDQKGRKK